MSVEEFRELARSDPPKDLTGALRALLEDARGDWASAHESAQSDDSGAGAWVHAYLHRKENDLGNAAYWYRRSGRPLPTCGLDVEWEQIAGELLADRES
jgi:hypothetical protein